MSNNNATIYYKYRDFKNIPRLLDVLKNGKLYASDFDKFNDPMDSFFEHKSENKIFLDGMKEQKSKKKILSLCKSPDNILMWTHYADEHRGMVIGVEIVDQNVMHIKYRKELPLFDSLKRENERYKKSFLKKVLTTKLLPWKYEEEVRVLSDLNEVNIRIKEIFFGHKTSDTHINLINQCIECQNITPVVSKKIMTLDDLNISFSFRRTRK